ARWTRRGRGWRLRSGRRRDDLGDLLSRVLENTLSAGCRGSGGMRDKGDSEENSYNESQSCIDAGSFGRGVDYWRGVSQEGSCNATDNAGGDARGPGNGSGENYRSENSGGEAAAGIGRSSTLPLSRCRDGEADRGTAGAHSGCVLRL